MNGEVTDPDKEVTDPRHGRVKKPSSSYDASVINVLLGLYGRLKFKNDVAEE